MEQYKKIKGLRTFLLGTLHLIAIGKKETCSFIEENLANGISTILFNKYKTIYCDCGFNFENAENVNEYYRQWYRCADGKEGLYVCSHDDGLQLLIALALNEIY